MTYQQRVDEAQRLLERRPPILVQFVCQKRHGMARVQEVDYGSVEFDDGQRASCVEHLYSATVANDWVAKRHPSIAGLLASPEGRARLRARRTPIEWHLLNDADCPPTLPMGCSRCQLRFYVPLQDVRLAVAEGGRFVVVPSVDGGVRRAIVVPDR